MVLVDEHEKAGEHIQLVEAAGRPAVVYYDSVTDDLKYRRALDPQGTVWAPPVVLSPRADSHNPHAAIVDGRPCVIYGDRIDNTVQFVAANDAAGSYWGLPLEFCKSPAPENLEWLWGFLYHQITQLADVAGAPVFCLLDRVDDGSAWGKDQILYESYY